MKRLLNKIVYNIPKIFLKKILIMESSPDYSDNAKAVFDELIKRKINDRIKIIWIVKDLNKFKDIKIKNVKFISFDQKIKYKYYQALSLYMMDCNYYLKKVNKHQKRIHLRHGESIKLSRDYCNQCGDVDYMIVLSSFFIPNTCDTYLIDKEKILPYGFPRNDVIINDKPMILFPERRRNKTILWMPTYRNHKDSKKFEYSTGSNFLYGVPCINSKEELINVNKLLKEKDILLIIKLHPAENKDKILSEELSNICLLDNSYFKDNKTIYNYLSGTDALITDYSSIYYDYLLTGKMIGLAIPDIDDYKKHVELLFEDFKENLPGEIINNNNDLCNFIVNVSNNKDVCKTKRLKKTKLYHEYRDGKAAKRVVDLFQKIM